MNQVQRHQRHSLYGDTINAKDVDYTVFPAYGGNERYRMGR